MTGLLLTAFFTLSAAIGATVLQWNLRHYLPAFAAARKALRDCPEMRDFRHSVRTIEVRSLGARIYRPDFTPAKVTAQPLRVAA